MKRLDLSLAVSLGYSSNRDFLHGDSERPGNKAVQEARPVARFHRDTDRNAKVYPDRFSERVTIDSLIRVRRRRQLLSRAGHFVTERESPSIIRPRGNAPIIRAGNFPAQVIISDSDNPRGRDTAYAVA